MKLTLEEKKQKEIVRWEKEKAKPQGRGYMAYFVLLITLVYIADEVVSQIGSQMQTVIASQVFAPIVGEEFAVARMAALGSVTMIGMILSFFYRPLSDRFGRRPFLILNTLGMGVATLIIALATNIPAYLIGATLCTFFVPHDMQAVYIQECAPVEHRAKMYSVVKAISTLAVFIIPLLRQIFIPGTDLTNWRYVYIVPAAMAIVAAVVAFLGIRESDAFIETRLRQLRMTEEEKAEIKAKKQNVENGGFFKAFRYIFSNKQLRWLVIVNLCMMLGVVITQNYEAIMTSGYAQQFLAQGIDLESARAEANTYVTQALMLFSIGSAVFQLFPGFLADKFGRKTSAVLTSAVTLVSFLIFSLGSANAWNPYVVGFFCGATIGCYWATTDTIGLMISESTPTTLRSSVLTVQAIFVTLGSVVSTIIFMVLTNIMGDAVISTCCLALAIPGFALGLLLLWLKAKETKGVDMSTI